MSEYYICQIETNIRVSYNIKLINTESQLNNTDAKRMPKGAKRSQKEPKGKEAKGSKRATNMHLKIRRPSVGRVRPCRRRDFGEVYLPYPSAVGGRHRAGPNLSGGCVKRKNTLGGLVEREKKGPRQVPGIFSTILKPPKNVPKPLGAG